jgi:hypothetical protein
MEEKLKNLCEFDVLDYIIKVYEFSHHYEKKIISCMIIGC